MSVLPTLEAPNNAFGPALDNRRERWSRGRFVVMGRAVVQWQS